MWVRLMFDYCSTGLWAREGYEMSTSDLPVTGELLERIEAWMVLTNSNEDALMFYKPCDDVRLCELKERERDYSFMGYELAKEIKSQLPAWTVMFYNEGFVDLPRDARNNSEIIAS